jgi:hypothetical protein
MTIWAKGHGLFSNRCSSVIMTRWSTFGASEAHKTPVTDGLLGALFPVKLSFLDFGAGFPAA